MSNFEPKRPYQKTGMVLRQMLIDNRYKVGEKLPAERELAEQLSVSRAVVREALIMLELENLVEVRKGSGVVVINIPNPHQNQHSLNDDIGPFEMLQARQLLESNIAEFAALQATPADIAKMRKALELEKNELLENSNDQLGDQQFHLCIAEATQNSLLVDLLKFSWEHRKYSPMWAKLHSRIHSSQYQNQWLTDHHKILNAIQKKDPTLAKHAMWQHLENVKHTLFDLSDVDDPGFDGYLYQKSPVVLPEDILN